MVINGPVVYAFVNIINEANDCIFLDELATRKMKARLKRWHPWVEFLSDPYLYLRKDIKISKKTSENFEKLGRQAQVCRISPLPALK